MIKNVLLYFCLTVALCSGCSERHHADPTVSPMPQNLGKNPRAADELEKKEAVATVFPRSDGAYRTQKRSHLIDVPNADIFDYLIFKEGQCYSVSGGYSPNKHFLRRPASQSNGMMIFTEKKSEIPDQPRDIQAWLADKTVARPANGPFRLLQDGKLESHQKFPAIHGRSAYEVVYVCKSTKKGMRVKRKWMSGGVETNSFVADYEFVSFDNPAPEAAPRSKEQVVADRIRELRASINLQVQLAKANSRASTYQNAYSAATGGPANLSRAGQKSQKLAAAEKALEQYLEDNSPLLISAFKILTNDQSRPLRNFAKSRLSKLGSAKLVKGGAKLAPTSPKKPFSIEEDFWKNARKYVSRKDNCVVTFPGRTFVDGNATVWEGASHWCQLNSIKSKKGREVDVLINGDSRSKYIALSAMEPIKGFRSDNLKVEILEQSPIRWKENYGFESSFAYQSSKGKLRIRRERILVVNDIIHYLTFDSRVFDLAADLAWLRFQDRRKANRFFESLNLIKPVKSKVEPPSKQQLEGRWVVKADSNEKQNSERTEYLFLNGQFYNFDEGMFGNPLGFTDLKQRYRPVKGDVGMIEITSDLSDLHIPNAYLRYQIEGETLVMEIRTKPIKALSRKGAIELMRPGAH